MRKKALPGGQQPDPPWGALEQHGAELVLEAADLPGHRGLRDVQAPRGPTDVLLLGDGHEVVELGEAHSGRVPGPGPRQQAGCKKGIAVSAAGRAAERVIRGSPGSLNSGGSAPRVSLDTESRGEAARREEACVEAKILVADEDVWVHRVVMSALSGADYAISTARNGAVALARALADPPHLVISDVRMPGMSGWRLVSKLRANRKLAATPFIFLTDLSSPESRRHGFRLGADDYLLKPVHPRELALRVASALRRGRPAQAAKAGPGDARGLSGTIEDISLASLLVLLEMERKTGLLVLSRRYPRERCRVFLREGRIIAAFLDGDGGRRHAELLYDVLGWSVGLFEFKSLPVEMRDEVQANTTQLLMEATWRQDEEARAPGGVGASGVAASSSVELLM